MRFRAKAQVLIAAMLALGATPLAPGACAARAQDRAGAGIADAAPESPGPGSPAAGGLRLGLQIGLIEGSQRSGWTAAAGWTAAEVHLFNAGERRSVELVVTLRPAGEGGMPLFSCRRVVALGAGASRREWFLLPLGTHSSYAAVAGARPVDGRRVAGEALLARDEVAFSGADARWRPALFVGGGDDLEQPYRGLDSFLSSPLNHWRRTAWREEIHLLLGSRAPEHLPERAEAYSGLAVVVLRDPDLGGLQPEQADALERWLEGGGTLLLVPGRRLAWLAQPALRRLTGGLELSVEQARELPGFERRYGAFALPVPERTPFGPDSAWRADAPSGSGSPAPSGGPAPAEGVRRFTLRVGPGQAPRARDVLHALPDLTRVAVLGDQEVAFAYRGPEEAVAEVVRSLVVGEVDVLGLSGAKTDLESVFLAVTRGNVQ